MHLSDLPPGWVAAGQSSIVQNQCPTLIRAKATASGRANPGYFVSNAARAEVQGAVDLYRTPAEATRWFTRVSGSGTRTCVGRLLREGLTTAGQPQGLSIGRVQARNLTIHPLGDERAASRPIVSVSGHGVSVDAVVDLPFVRVGRGIASMLSGGAEAPFNSALEEKLLGTATERLSAGLTRGSPAG